MNVLITRERQQAEATSEIFARYGLKPFILPMVAFEEIKAVFPLKEYDYCILSSPTAAVFYAKYSKNITVNKYMAVGVKTAEKLSELLNIPLESIAVPEEYYITELSNLLEKEKLKGKTVLSPGAETRIKDMDAFFKEKGARYDCVSLYRTVPVSYSEGYIEKFIAENAIDAVVFMSPSSVNAFFSRAKLSSNVKIASVGTSTEDAVKKYNMQAVMPEKQTAESVAEMLAGRDNQGFAETNRF